MKKTTIPHIGIFCGDISKGGGTERMAAFLATSLHETGKYQISIISITESQSPPCFPIADSIPKYQLHTQWVNPGIMYFPLIFRLLRLISREHISLLIDVDQVLDILSIPCKWLTGIQVISWEHFHFFETLGTSYRAPLHRFTCRFSDYIITLTEQDQADYIRFGHPHCPVKCITNPVPDTSVPSSLKQEKVVLSMGNLVPGKRFEDLVEAAHRLIPRFPDWKFIIFGEGPQRQYLETLVQNYGLEKHVFFPGYCSQVSYAYAEASIFALASESEGLSMVLVEAKFHRLPSISYDIKNGPRAIILDNRNGYLIPPFDLDMYTHKLGQLMENEALRTSFSEHAWDNIAPFDRNNILQAWLCVLEELFS